MCTSSEGLPNPEDARPEIPIDEFTASALGLSDTVEELISAGTNVNKSNIEGWTMLQYASFIGHTNLVNLLLDKGADPNKGTCPPLMLAARCGNEPILIALMSKNASLEQVDNSGLTALQHAVTCGQDGSVAVLLRHSKRKSPSESNVLLHSAVSHANVGVLKVLLDGGLVPSSATKLSMIEVSQSRGDNDLLQLVVSCGNTPQQSRLSEDTSNRYLQRGPLEIQKLMQQSRNTANRRLQLGLTGTPALQLGPTGSPGLSPVGIGPGGISPRNMVSGGNTPGTLTPETMTPGSIVPGLKMGMNAVSPTTPANPPVFSPPTFVSVDEVLKYLKLEKYAPHFEREDIDIQTFLTLTDADLKAITIDLLGPRKKILNYIKLAQSSADPTNELHKALLNEQHNVLALKEKIKQDRDNDSKNQQIMQSLFMSYQNIRENKDKILTSLTNACFIVQNLQEELTACKDKLPRYTNAFSNSDSNNNFSSSQGSSQFALSWPTAGLKDTKHTRQPSEETVGEHIALSSVHSVLGGGTSPYKDDKNWTNSWDDCNSGTGSSTSTLNASGSTDKLRKHLESAALYTSTLLQHIQEGKQSANNLNTALI